MSGVDPNVILAATSPPPFNPLVLQSQVLGIQGAQANIANAQAQNQILGNENQAFQQKQQANQLLAGLYAKHTNAAGNTDMAGVQSDLAQAASTNPAAVDAMSTVLSQNTAQSQAGTAGQQLTQAQIQTAQAHAGLMATTLSGVVAMPDPTVKDVASAVADMAGHADNGDPDIATKGADFIASLPDGIHGADLKARIAPYLVQAQSAQGQLAALTGSPAAVNNGAGTSFQAVNPVAGTVTPLSGPTGQPAFVPNQLSPGEKVARTSYVDAQGITHSVPIGQIADSEGNPTQTGANLTTGMAPGAAETLTANTARVQQIQHQAATAPTRLAAMQDVHAVIDNALPTAFGPTSDLTSRVGKLAAAFGASSPNAVNGQASIEELNKSLTLIASQQAAELGAGTDASRAMVHDSNPSLANSKAGLERNLAVVQGNEMYGVAKNRALQQAMSNGMQPSQVPQFEAAFNKEISPLVFQAHNMDVQGQREVFNSLAGSRNKDGTYSGEKGAFLNALDKATHYGWFSGQ